MKIGCVGAMVLGLLLSAAATANWHDERGGATKQYYSSQYRLEWRQPLGDWLDADGALNGDNPYLSAKLSSAVSGNYLEMDVTKMLQASRSSNGDDFLEVDFFFRSPSDFKFSSRENTQFAPSLEFYVGDQLRQYFSKRDTQLDSSTNKNLGAGGSVKVGRRSNGLLGFSVPKSLIAAPNLKKIVLRLHIAKVYGGGTTLHVFRVASGHAAAQAVVSSSALGTGIAAKYSSDRGLEADENVLFFDDFDSRHSAAVWGERGRRVKLAGGASERGGALQKALEVTVRKGKNKGLNRRYKFKVHGIDEPEEAFFRYYLRLSRHWNSDISGGKFPGFAGTYGKAGWGGRKATAEGGWSARGFFFSSANDQNDELRTPLGNYVYHLDQTNRYGSDWVWSENGAALLENDRWYSVEQQVKLNTPGRSDGILRGWLDGRLVFEKTNLRFRGSTALKIEEVWFNVYHGGGDPAPRDLVLYMDNVVIARDYIGPMSAAQ